MAKRKTSQQKKSAENLKKYRKLYTQAKKAGLVKGDKKAGSLKPSKYMKSKLNKLAPYLGGEYEFLKPKTKKEKATAKAFKRSPTPFVPGVINNRVIVKRVGGAKPKFDNGILKRVRHLEAGAFEHIPMPFRPKDLNDLKNYVETNEYLNDVLKNPDEFFNFTIFGNKSHDSYGDLESLIDALENFYAVESFPEDWVNLHLELYRSYKDWKHAGNTGALRSARVAQRNRERMAAYRQRLASNPARYSRYLENAKAARDASPGYAAKKQKQKENRKNETVEQREQRLAKVREWKRKNKKTD